MSINQLREKSKIRCMVFSLKKISLIRDYDHSCVSIIRSWSRNSWLGRERETFKRGETPRVKVWRLPWGRHLEGTSWPTWLPWRCLKTRVVTETRDVCEGVKFWGGALYSIQSSSLFSPHQLNYEHRCPCKWSNVMPYWPSNHWLSCIISVPQKQKGNFHLTKISMEGRVTRPGFQSQLLK